MCGRERRRLLAPRRDPGGELALWPRLDLPAGRHLRSDPWRRRRGFSIRGRSRHHFGNHDRRHRLEGHVDRDVRLPRPAVRGPWILQPRALRCFAHRRLGGRPRRRRLRPGGRGVWPLPFADLWLPGAPGWRHRHQRRGGHDRGLGARLQLRGLESADVVRVGRRGLRRQRSRARGAALERSRQLAGR